MIESRSLDIKECKANIAIIEELDKDDNLAFMAHNHVLVDNKDT